LIGKTLGNYEIQEKIGAGGMGEVYRARDVRLDRIVAIKVLPPHFADDPERRQRFEREARTISSLSHPGICTLHDLGHDEDTHYLVMEYLEGETLGQRLLRGPLPMDEVFRVGADIAEALDRAHRAGIVHRDLKPGNVMLTRDGMKLLDFGLAKSGVEDQPTSSLIATQATPQVGSADEPLTAEGTILGTFQYMAPEQLEGQEADKRSDIFALGALLYEMATGRKAFAGKSQASLIVSILEREPQSIASLQPMTPPAFEHTVGKCLVKDADERWQSAQDVAGQLRWIAEESSSRVGVPKTVSTRRKGRERGAWAVAGVAVIVAAALAALWVTGRPSAPEVTRFEFPMPKEARFATNPRISPDGRSIAFTVFEATGASIWIRTLDDLEPRRVSGAEGADLCFWSPDGRHLAFIDQGKLRKVAVTGGPPQTICDAPTGDDGSWGEDGDILFDGGLNDAISRVAASGGVPQGTMPPDTTNGLTYGWPEFLPDGRHFLCLGIEVESQDRREFQLVCGDLEGDEVRNLGTVGSRVHYAAPGYLLSVTENTLVAQPFDAGRLEFTGEPIPLAEGLPVDDFGGTPFSVSRNGTLVYRVQHTPLTQLVWRDRSGRVLDPIGSMGGWRGPSVSPDGKRVAAWRTDAETEDEDIWILDSERGTVTRLTFESGAIEEPIWSPDGRSIAYTAVRGADTVLLKIAASGVGVADTLALFPRYVAATDWSRDGSLIAVQHWGGATRLDVAIVDVAAGIDREPVTALGTEFRESHAAFSPDGRWLAYRSDESGRNEVYVRSYPGTRASGKSPRPAATLPGGLPTGASSSASRMGP
jgi:dipeptidyl aminopeptidase/acylaminoacyl peptidase